MPSQSQTEALRWRSFQRIVQAIKARNDKRTPADIQRIVDEAVLEVRADRSLREKKIKA